MIEENKPATVPSVDDVVTEASEPEGDKIECWCGAVGTSPERTYDIWKDGHLIAPNQDREQIRAWIKKNTPEWLYDDSETTEAQKQLVFTWLDAFRARYPGTMVVA